MTNDDEDDILAQMGATGSLGVVRIMFRVGQLPEALPTMAQTIDSLCTARGIKEGQIVMIVDPAPPA